MFFLSLATLRQVLELKLVLVYLLPSFEEFPHISGIESFHPFKISYKGWAIRSELVIQILQYPISPRKPCNYFQVKGEGNWKIP